MRTLFLNPPSYDDFDGGAGSRYQAKREVWSFWYPTWLSYPAGMLPGARLLDAPPLDMTVDEVVRIARDYDHVVLHTSTPSFRADVRTAQALKDAKPDTVIGVRRRARHRPARGVAPRGAGDRLRRAEGVRPGRRRGRRGPAPRRREGPELPPRRRLPPDGRAGAAHHEQLDALPFSDRRLRTATSTTRSTTARTASIRTCRSTPAAAARRAARSASGRR